MTLLKTGYRRLFRNKIFWILVIGFALGGLIPLIVELYETATDYNNAIFADEYWYGFLAAMGGALALLGAFLIGTEYSDGGVRNKVIAGVSRTKIYFSNLLIMVTAALLFALAYLLPHLLLDGVLIAVCRHSDVYVLWNSTHGVITDIASRSVPAADMMAKTMLLALCNTLAYAAVITLICSACRSKTVALTVGLGVIALLFGLEAWLYPKRLLPAGYHVVSGSAMDRKLKLLRFLELLSPAGLTVRIVKQNVLYFFTEGIFFSLGIAALSSLAGWLIFRRKALD